MDASVLTLGGGEVPAIPGPGPLLTSEQSACLVRGFVQAKDEGQRLLSWAERLCGLGEEAADELRYLEGHGARGGETYSQQLARQLKEDFEAMRSGLEEDGVDLADFPGLADAQELDRLRLQVEAMMRLYDATLEPADALWSVKLEINAPGACIKLHDDFVHLRLVSALVGEGTVIAPDESVDWKVYNEEPLAAGRNNGEKCRQWNGRVASRELASVAGDVVLMRGGRGGVFRPCLHRAPYSADCGKQSRRLLITVERISAEERAAFAAAFDESEEDASEEGADDAGCGEKACGTKRKLESD